MPKNRNFFYAVLMSLCMSLALSACSSTSDQSQNQDPIMVGNIEIQDPYEGFNRVMFSFNEGIDTVLLDPATMLYRAILPGFVRDGVHNVLENLKSPIYLANEVLQGDWKGAGTVTQRFLVNSVAGLGGVMDVAGWQGEEYIPEDFGQTLATWGVGEGSYMVLPIIGPSTTRHSVGRVADLGFDPLFWYGVVGDESHDWIGYARGGATLLDTKDQLMDALNDLKENSLDPYAAVRSVYYQRRAAMIQDETMETNAAPDIPDYDDEEE